MAVSRTLKILALSRLVQQFLRCLRIEKLTQVQAVKGWQLKLRVPQNQPLHPKSKTVFPPKIISSSEEQEQSWWRSVACRRKVFRRLVDGNCNIPPSYIPLLSTTKPLCTNSDPGQGVRGGVIRQTALLQPARKSLHSLYTYTRHKTQFNCAEGCKVVANTFA